MSAFGPQRTCASVPQMSAFGGKADMTRLRLAKPLYRGSEAFNLFTCRLTGSAVVRV